MGTCAHTVGMSARVPATCLLVALMGAGLMAIQAAQAAQQPRARCESSPECEGILFQAHARSKSGHLDEALQLYKAAYALQADPRILYNTGRVLHRMGRTAEAAELYQRALDSGDDDADMLRRARSHLGELRATAPNQSSVLVPASPAAATTCPPASSETPRFYRRPWFWGLIAAGGTLVIGSVVTGIVIGTQTDIIKLSWMPTVTK